MLELLEVAFYGPCSLFALLRPHAGGKRFNRFAVLRTAKASDLRKHLEVNHPRLEGEGFENDGLSCGLKVLRSALIFNPEGFVTRHRLLPLQADILLDYLIRYVTRSRHEVSPSPHVAAPELSIELLVLRKELVGGLAFEGLHDL